jgi:hypothetical protein
VYRFSNYNELVTAPRNTLGGGGAPSAWNNQGTNAADSSVLYLNGFLDLSGRKARGGRKELVLTVPPSRTNYYIVNVLDTFANTVGSIGTRTTPSMRPQTYLLVGPTSRYAHRRSVRIHGFTYRVLSLDTNRDWVLIRIRANSLVPARDPASVASIEKRVVERFALNTLASFEARGHRPKYFKAGTYSPTRVQNKRAAKWYSAPKHAIAFFKQMGEALRLNPLPTARTGLNGIPLSKLPSWVVPQAGATATTARYSNPSYPQQSTLAQFKPLGLTANGFRIPSNWGQKQINALRRGYKKGQEHINKLVTAGRATRATNYWTYQNSGIGNYPNTPAGYLNRAFVTISGAAANIPADAVYAQINNLNGRRTTQLVGNHTYKLTFKPPVPRASVPVVGSLPPTQNGVRGPLGFWSVTVYQPDTDESAAPFLTQASVVNTAYSSANIAVTRVDASTDTITVTPSTWGPLVRSSPILFGPAAARYGLKQGVPYYVATTPKITIDPMTKGATYSFKVSTKWLQQLSKDDVPIQDTGRPGRPVNLTNPGGAVDLRWGPIQPVSQLGSQQLDSGDLARNRNRSVTIWIGPTPPKGAPATNWIPTPSTRYYANLYHVVTVPKIRVMIRIYYPRPGSDRRASILPPPEPLPPPYGRLDATYVLPALQMVG